MSTGNSTVNTTTPRPENSTAATDKTDSGYPTCKEFFCDVYWDVPTIVGWSNSLISLGVAILIFLLGTKMQKDFIRSITVSIFVPLFLAELFNFYCETVNFMWLFCSSQNESMEFYESYVEWSSQLVDLFQNYNHYNCLIMMLLLLHCCRLATKPGDHINLFPMNSICLVLQIIPFFVSVLLYVEQQALHSSILAVAFISRIVTVVGVIALVGLIIFTVPVLTRELPYGHAVTPDIQLQDARSRLAWCLVYVVVPLITLIPFFIESIVWISVMGKKSNKTTEAADIIESTRILMDPLKFLVSYYRPTWLVIITMAFLPPYRRAVPLLLMSCSCCPQVKVEAVPRRAKETSNMYRYAD